MKFDPSDFTISDKSTLEDALCNIEANHQGFALIVNGIGAVTGVVTDGDIRRSVLEGVAITDNILKSVNTNFFWAEAHTARETILKHLDNDFKFVPVLDENKRLVHIITRDYMPLQDEMPIYVRSRAPVRVSFGGGGSDLTHYFANNSGAVINAAISIFCHATLRIRNDGQINISSMDLDDTLNSANLDEAINNPGKFRLITSVLKVINPSYGFDLYLNSDFSVGSGLGGSASVAVAVLGCFNMLRRDRWDKYELAELAFQAERIYLGVPGGWQDQYAAVFGGFNFIEFNMDQHIVNPIRMEPATIMELEESLILCNTGILHDSGEVHENQEQSMKSKEVQSRVKDNVELTHRIKNHLLRGQLSDFGKELDRAWGLKKSFSSGISNESLDKIYKEAIENGAIGGKLLGAGGGGYFLFHVSPFHKHQLCRHLHAKGLSVAKFKFESDGVQAWAVRDQL